MGQMQVPSRLWIWPMCSKLYSVIDAHLSATAWKFYKNPSSISQDLEQKPSGICGNQYKACTVYWLWFRLCWDASMTFSKYPQYRLCFPLLLNKCCFCTAGRWQLWQAALEDRTQTNKVTREGCVTGMSCALIKWDVLSNPGSIT